MRYRLIAGTINEYMPEDGWANVHLDISDRPIYHQGLNIFVQPDLVVDLADTEEVWETFRDQASRFDEVRLHHVLEHVSLETGARMLSNIQWLLKPGGTLDVEVPDFNRVVDAWRAGDLDLEHGLQQWVFGEELRDHLASDSHRSAWTSSLLADALRTAGLEPGDPIDAGHAARYRATKPEED